MQLSLRKNIKLFYDFLPFKRQIFNLLKKVWSPPETVYKHLHFKGNITVPIDKSHSFKMTHYGFQLENDIFWSGLNGKWEKESIGIWVRLCRDSEVVFDVGANTGIYSLITKV